MITQATIELHTMTDLEHQGRDRISAAADTLEDSKPLPPPEDSQSTFVETQVPVSRWSRAKAWLSASWINTLIAILGLVIAIAIPLVTTFENDGPTESGRPTNQISDGGNGNVDIQGPVVQGSPGATVTQITNNARDPQDRYIIEILLQQLKTER